MINLIKKWFGVDFVVIPNHPEVEVVEKVVEEAIVPKSDISEPIYSFVKYFKKNRKQFEVKGGEEVFNLKYNSVDIADLEILDILLGYYYKVKIHRSYKSDDHKNYLQGQYVTRLYKICKVDDEVETELTFLTPDELQYLQTVLWEHYKKVEERSKRIQLITSKRVQRQEYMDIYCKPSL